ncbi:MAG: ABC transporter permease [Clostridiales bacterium]|jgi:multidrug/hemolysin transport system permease protein|nr:ABC transporter permease [Clostridiales bacterium]
MLKALIIRNIKIFLRNKATLLFTCVSPLIILVLYTMFLRKMYVSHTEGGYWDSSSSIPTELAKRIVDGWLIAGVLSVSIMSVALNSCFIMAADKQNGVVNDLTASPVNPLTVTAAYYISSLILTLAVSGALLAAAFIYCACGGATYTAADVFLIICNLIVSALSAVAAMTLVMGFFRSLAAAGAFSGVFSVMIGFFTGAFMPLSWFPQGLVKAATLVPGAHSANLFRRFFMLSQAVDLPAATQERITGHFILTPQFVGAEISVGAEFAVLAASVLFFLALSVIVGLVKRRNKRR